MPKPNPTPGCPPGLEMLTQIDKVLVQQQMNLLQGKLLKLKIKKRQKFQIKFHFSFRWYENYELKIRIKGFIGFVNRMGRE